MREVGIIGRQTSANAITTTLSFSVPLDAEGRHGISFGAGWPSLLLFFAYRIFFESHGGRTLGRLITGVRLEGKDRPDADRKQLLRRYLAAYGANMAPLAAADAWALFETRYSLLGHLGPVGFLGLYAALSLPAIVAGLLAVIAMIRRRPTFYDRFAETDVVETR